MNEEIQESNEIVEEAILLLAKDKKLRLIHQGETAIYYVASGLAAVLGENRRVTIGTMGQRNGWVSRFVGVITEKTQKVMVTAIQRIYSSEQTRQRKELEFQRRDFCTRFGIKIPK